MLFAGSIENLKNLKYTFLKKTVLSIMCSKCKNENEKLFKEEESISIEISKITALIENI